jgi:hypothetical protein
MTRTAILLTRAGGALAIVTAYAVFRLPLLTSPWEAAATWIGAIVLGGIALRSIEDLAVQRRDYLSPDEPSVLELTDVLPTPVPRTPVTMLDDTDRFRIHGELFADTIAFEQGRARLVDRGEFVEPELLTHEYHPLTPPHGVPTLAYLEEVGRWNAAAAAEEHAGRHRLSSDSEDAIVYATSETTGRHALADAQLNRERAHGQFGMW